MAETYDTKYQRENYFGYKTWVYRPFIKAIAERARLKVGSRVLDAGCGQGFFAALFGNLGFEVVGVDLSVEAIRTAKRSGRRGKIRFHTGDVLALPYKAVFDCVYCRSCSLYNNDTLGASHQITEALLSYLKPGGVLIFDYYTKLSRRKESRFWRYHSLLAVRRHFEKYHGACVYFSLRVETLALGSWTFTRPVTLVNVAVSRLTGVGGEAIALIPAPAV